MTRAIDSVIFDLDGTLWTSCPLCTRAWNDAVAELGVARVPLTEDDLGSIMGHTLEEAFARLFPDLDDGQMRRLADACFAREAAYILREGGQFYPGVEDGLRKLEKTLRLSVVSNCEPSYLDAFLSWSQLDGMFEDTECHGATGLPKGANIARVVERNGFVSPVYVGDTEGDRKAADEAGVPFLQVTYGFGPPLAGARCFATFASLVAHLVGQ